MVESKMIEERLKSLLQLSVIEQEEQLSKLEKEFGVKKTILKQQLNHFKKEIVEEGKKQQQIKKQKEKAKEKSKKELKRIVDKEKKKQEPKFDYSYTKPEKEITSIEQVEEVIKKNFPDILFETKASLAVNASICLKNLNGCPALIFIGNPSGEKTTLLSFCYGHERSYISDDFTPRAFVSHSANVGKEELESVDLLPKLKDKVLITPELAPLFEAAKDRQVDNFAMLTRVLDGEGLNRDSGSHGQRGYSGDYKFAWLGASTPLRYSVWNLMGKIGNRLFFLNMKDKNRTDTDYLNMFSGKAYEEKVKECRGVIISFLENLYKKNGIRQIQWEAENDILLLPQIIKYAKLLSRLRASLMTWKSEEQGKYEYSFPVIEEPPRAINSLYNLAKGNAIIHGRNFLRTEDLEIVRRVAFSSMPHDRFEFLKLLAKHEGKLTTRQIENELYCSQDTALRTMQTFEILGVVQVKSIETEQSGFGRPLKYIEIKPEFEELLQTTQVFNSEINSKPDKITGVGEEKYNIKPQEFIKKLKNNALSHPENSEIKPLPQENNTASDSELNISYEKI